MEWCYLSDIDTNSDNTKFTKRTNYTKKFKLVALSLLWQRREIVLTGVRPLQIFSERQ